MKRFIWLLMLLPTLAWAQPRYATLIADCTVVLDNIAEDDSSDVDTLMIPVWNSNMRGYPHLLITPTSANVESVGFALGSKHAATDSLTVMWRPCLAPDAEDTLTLMAFKVIPIWRCGALDIDFSWFDWDSAGTYWGILDMESQTPDWIQVRSAYKGYSHHDTLSLRIRSYDIQK